ncbi:MAG TPA: hypothetical protein VLI92_01855 [Candidatus Saccharimonadales bacterium]|nr:hypothetical protein [Candidatus Saccharimonadales bacterium]
MILIDKNSKLWAYLADDIKGLLADGENLVNEAEHFSGKISDYSYLVFPFSKGYEGFLKKLFLDLHMIRDDEYYGDDIRIGRVLNPHYTHEPSSVYKKILLHKNGGEALGEKLWNVWKRGRNSVFHYFPHNFKKLTYAEALEIITEELSVMEATVSLVKS